MDKRSHARKGISLDCFVFYDEAEKTCHLLDISPGGARVRLRGAYELGQKMTLSITGVGDFESEVRWARNGTLGLGFLGDPEDIAETLYDFLVYGAG